MFAPVPAREGAVSPATDGRATAETAPPAARPVLIIEDSPDVSSLLAAALEDEGCEVRIARDGGEALRLARTIRPSLITLDLGLPDTTGWDLVDALRAAPETSDTPIIAVSAHVGVLDADFAAKVARVIAKPFYLSEVVAVALELLGRPLRDA